jgi:hypothetical protein
MVSAVIAFPVLVTGGIEKADALSSEQIMDQLNISNPEDTSDPLAQPSSETDPKPAEDDPMKALMEDSKRGK